MLLEGLSEAIGVLLGILLGLRQVERAVGSGVYTSRAVDWQVLDCKSRLVRVIAGCSFFEGLLLGLDNFLHLLIGVLFLSHVLDLDLAELLVDGISVLLLRVAVVL